MSFSFSEKPVLFILHRFPSLLPGINRVVAIYYDKDLQKLNSYSLIKGKVEYILEESDVNDSGESLQQFRKVTAPHSWIQAEDVPFEISLKNNVQLTIFNELNNNILLLRQLNDYDGFQDLFFVYFSNSPSNFGIVDSNKIITTENKKIIGHLLKNTIDTLISNFREDRELFISLSENNHTIIQELNQKRRELTDIREKNKDGVVHLCKSYLVDLSREYGHNFLLTDEAISKLRDFDEDPGRLGDILKKAVQYAQSAHLYDSTKEIMIYDYHLIFNFLKVKRQADIAPSREQTNEIPASDIPVRYNKTFLFLNKLENAAQTVKSKNLLLTSANVGHEFPSPITPSAITDALKNHQSKINYLFKLLPTRWQVIRSEFRPVQNILNPKAERQKRTG